MAWVRKGDHWFDSTKNDDDPSAYMTDEQFQAAFQNANPNPLWLERRTGVTESGMTSDEHSWTPAESSMGFVTNTKPTTGRIVDAGEYGDFSSPFWQNRYDPTKTHWTQVIRDLGQGGVPSLQVMQDLVGSGFLNRFPSYANDPKAQEQVGALVAQMQDYEDSSKSQADFQALSVLLAPLMFGAGEWAAGAAGGADTATGAAAAGATTGAIRGAMQAGLSGENIGEGALESGLEGGARAGVTSFAGGALSDGVTTITGSADSLMNDLFSDFGSASEVTTGVTSTPENILVADAGTSMTDVGPGLLQSDSVAVQTPGVGDGGGMDQFGEGAKAFDYTSPKQGLLDSVVQWGKDNPLLSVGVLQLGGSVLKGIGDSKRQERQHAHERDLVDRRQQQVKELEEWRRVFSNAGAFTGSVPVRPSGASLRRPDGTPVFAPSGLLTSTVR